MDPEIELSTLPEITLRPVLNSRDIEHTQEIFTEYLNSLELDLGFQDIASELANLTEHYALSEDGIILLAFVEESLAGCAGLRPLPGSDYINACEMRRLYVRPTFRGFGLGQQLTEALLEHARTIGYAVLLLDTMNEQETAREFYRALDFEEIPPYYYNPLPGAHYLKVDLM